MKHIVVPDFNPVNRKKEYAKNAYCKFRQTCGHIAEADYGGAREKEDWSK